MTSTESMVTIKIVRSSMAASAPVGVHGKGYESQENAGEEKLPHLLPFAITEHTPARKKELSLSTLAVSSANGPLVTEWLRDSQRTSVRASNAG